MKAFRVFTLAVFHLGLIVLAVLSFSATAQLGWTKLFVPIGLPVLSLGKIIWITVFINFLRAYYFYDRRAAKLVEDSDPDSDTGAEDAQARRIAQILISGLFYLAFCFIP